MILRALRVPVGWKALAVRTGQGVIEDNCLGLAAQLAYYFFLALFPALLFLVALASFFPVRDLTEIIIGSLARVAPGEVLTIVRDQVVKIGESQKGGLLTLGMIGTIWSASSGVAAIIDTLNQVYDVQERRPWWRVRLLALGLTVALAIFILVSTVLVVAGPAIAEKVAGWFQLGSVFTWTWIILQWPVVFALVSLVVAVIYYFGPDTEQHWKWITPGSIAATVLWLLLSLGFKVYVTKFGEYNATYGTIGAVIVLLLWFYGSALAVLTGAELNAEIEHASPLGKDPGDRALPDGAAAAANVAASTAAVRSASPATATNCDVDDVLLPAAVPASSAPRPHEWILSAAATGLALVVTYRKVKARAARLETPAG